MFASRFNGSQLQWTSDGISVRTRFLVFQERISGMILTDSSSYSRQIWQSAEYISNHGRTPQACWNGGILSLRFFWLANFRHETLRSFVSHRWRQRYLQWMEEKYFLLFRCIVVNSIIGWFCFIRRRRTPLLLLCYYLEKVLVFLEISIVVLEPAFFRKKYD